MFQLLLQGVSTLLESLAFALGDAGDVFVINFPVYARFASDISERAQIKLMGPALKESEDFELRFELFKKKPIFVTTFMF